MVITIIELDALDMRLDSVKSQLGTAAVGVGVSRERACLQQVQARLFDRLRRSISLDLGTPVVGENFDIGKNVIEGEPLLPGFGLARRIDRRFTVIVQCALQACRCGLLTGCGRTRTTCSGRPG